MIQALMLFVGLLFPWVSGVYLGGRGAPDMVFRLPGGPLYAASVVVFVVLTGVVRRGGTVRTVVAVGLTIYPAFWLVGEVILSLSPPGSIWDLRFDSGLFISLAGGALAVHASRAARKAGGPLDGADTTVTLADRDGDPTSEFTGREAFVERLTALCAEPRSAPVPVIVVRLGGIDRLSGDAAAEQLAAVLTHRLRSSVRATDIAATFSPGEVFVVPADTRSATTAGLVAARIQAALAAAVGSVSARAGHLVDVSVRTARADVGGGRLRITTHDEILVDAPIVLPPAGGPPAADRDDDATEGPGQEGRPDPGLVRRGPALTQATRPSGRRRLGM